MGRMGTDITRIVLGGVAIGGVTDFCYQTIPQAVIAVNAAIQNPASPEIIAKAVMWPLVPLLAWLLENTSWMIEIYPYRTSKPRSICHSQEERTGCRLRQYSNV